MNSRQERFSKLAPLLKRLKRNVGKKRSDIIRKCDNDLICSLSKCCHKHLKRQCTSDFDSEGKTPSTQIQPQKLSLKKTSIKQRKKILQRGGFFGALITPILSVLGILFNGTRYEDGTG